jgi:hypothetical protein
MGYSDLPPMWVLDFFHWLVIVALFGPFVLGILLVTMGFVGDCLNRSPRCSSCGRPWH